jgi:hypothetical protein
VRGDDLALFAVADGLLAKMAQQEPGRVTDDERQWMLDHAREALARPRPSPRPRPARARRRPSGPWPGRGGSGRSSARGLRRRTCRGPGTSRTPTARGSGRVRGGRPGRRSALGRREARPPARPAGPRCGRPALGPRRHGRRGRPARRESGRAVPGRARVRISSALWRTPARWSRNWSSRDGKGGTSEQQPGRGVAGSPGRATGVPPYGNDTPNDAS